MKTYKINEIKYKRTYGRNCGCSEITDAPVALLWGAAAIEVNVKASDLWIQLSSDYSTHEPWVAIEVNGYQISRFMVPKGEPTWYCIANNLNPEKENLITIIKDTQAMAGDLKHALFVHQLGFSSNGEFCELKPKNLNIEFIGDSITSGEGLAGKPDEGDWITQWFCASKTYAIQTAKALNAGWSVLSQCGWGLCWGWDGNRNSNLPSHYENVCSLLNSDFHKKLGALDKFDFNSKNDYVILNLGTNDNGAFFQPPWKDENGNEYVLTVDENKKASKKDGKIIIQETKNFLKLLRLHNPQAKIIWTWGMIKLQTVPELIGQGIKEYIEETGDTKVYSLEFDSMEELEVLEEDKGSRGHPGPKTHKKAAEALIKFIKELN